MLTAQTSRGSKMTVYKDGTALVKQEIIWNNIQKGESLIKYDDIPRSIHKDTPFIKFDNAQLLNQRFVEKVFSSVVYFKSKEGSEIIIKPKKRMKKNLKMLMSLSLLLKMFQFFLDAKESQRQKEGIVFKNK